MAFPQVIDADTVTGGQSADTTQHPVTLPANRSNGDRILVCFACDGTPTVSGWPTGWTVVGTQNTTVGADKIVVAEKIVSGGEANFSLTTSVGEQSSYHAYRITGAHATTASEAAGINGGTSTVDFPLLNPAGWGTEDTLWFIVGAEDNGTRTVSTWPANYTGGQRRTGFGTSAAGVALATAWRELNAASEDPGILTWSAGPNAGGLTVAIRPTTATLLAGNTRTLLYNISTRASTTRQLLYDVGAVGLAGKAVQVRYDVRAFAGKTRQILYNISGLVGKSAIILYDANPGPPVVQISRGYRLTEEQAEQAMLRGNFGQLEYRYRMWRSDNLSRRIQELETVEEASFSLDNLRDHTWELSLPMDAVDYFDIWGDWVRLEVEMRTGAGISGGEYVINRPFGLYFFDERGGEDAPERRRWDLGGKSPEARLMGATAHAGYSIAAGAGILASVRTILLNQGVPASMIVMPPTSSEVVMGTTTYFDPFNNATDTRWLRICNTLLAAGGFLALFADNSGRITTRKINPSNRIQASHTYGTTPESDRMIVSEAIPYIYDDENFANRVVVYSGDPSEAASFGVAENHDPNSHVSYERLGYWVQKEPIELPSLVSTTEAQIVAMQALRVASGMSLRLNFETIFDTRVRPRQAYGLEVFGDDGEPYYTGDVWPALNVSASLDLSAMTHEVQHGVSL